MIEQQDILCFVLSTTAMIIIEMRVQVSLSRTISMLVACSGGLRYGPLSH